MPATVGQNPKNIHIGAARIFLGVTPPATSVTDGAPPTPMAIDESGAPTSGIEVGYTQDAATFTYKQVKQEVEAEQSLNPVDVFNTTEEITIEFNAMEHVYATLKTAFDNVGSTDDTDMMMFYGGDGAGLVNVLTQCVVLTSRIRTAPTKFEVLTIYRVYNVEGVSIPYNRTGVAIYKIQLKGLTDTTRKVGDRLFQWYREKGGEVATGATSGSPGTWTPDGSVAPPGLGGMGPIIASPLTAWTAGAHMVLGDTSKCYWNATAWVSGAAGALLRRGEEGAEGEGGNGEKTGRKNGPEPPPQTPLGQSTPPSEPEPPKPRSR